LKNAFRDLADTSSARCTEEDLDQVWRAVSGDLPPETRRAMVARIAVDPAYAEAWRVAHELQQAHRGDLPASALVTPRSWSPAWLGLAAALLVGVGITLFQIPRQPENTFRTQAPYAVESPIPSDASLARDAFVLRWTPGPEGSRYQLRLTTEDLRVVAAASDIGTPEYRVPADSLSNLPAGSRLFWQVVVSMPNGERISSPTFVVRVQ
jgi:hypothetical protein